jgi:hypothetical protein
MTVGDFFNSLLELRFWFNQKRKMLFAISGAVELAATAAMEATLT